MCGKLSELHCNALLVSNRGETVIKWRKTMGQICPLIFLAFQTFSPGLENYKTSKCGSESFPRMYFVCRKLPELHFDAYLSPNPGETVLNCDIILWTQDLRVKQRE